MVGSTLQVHLFIQILVISPHHVYLAGLFCNQDQCLSTTGLPDVYHKNPGSRCPTMVSRVFYIILDRICLPKVYHDNILALFL